MAVHYRTQGFILKKEDLREADRLFTVFTKDFGKLELLARSVRKIKSKLRGGLGQFWLSEVEFIQGKTYKTLTDTNLIDNFKNLKGDLKRLTVAYKIAEVLDNLVKGEEPDERIWGLLRGVLQRLNIPTLKASRLPLIYYYFFWNLLSILGYEPELDLCVSCQKKLTPENLYFNFEEGGVICGNCFRKIKPKLSEQRFVESKSCRPEVIKLLRLLLREDWQTLTKIKIASQYWESLKDISDNYYSYILNQ